MSEHDEQERRRYFRVEDQVHLRYRKLTREQFEHWLANPPEEGSDSCDLMLQLNALSLQTAAILAGIRKQHHEIGQYLALLDRKIDLVARAAAGKELKESNKPNARVDLSASGITFDRQEPLEEDSHVEMQLVVFPSRLCIRTCARVVHCVALDDTNYRIGLEFDWLSENAREALFRHTLTRQSALLREKRGKKEGE